MSGPPGAQPGRHPGSRLYRTGDLARCRPDGAIEFLGRRDNQVKILGMRVELEEVEAALAALPAVRDVCCTVAESGPGGPAIAAYIVTAKKRQHVVEDIRPQLARILPEQMLPSRITEVDALPRLPNGKVDRRSLAHLRTSRPPEARQHAAPRDAVEGQLQEIWADCLARPNVGVIDDFFELGGHSLPAAHVMAEVRRRLGSEISLAAFFGTPTIEGLARLIRAEIGVPPRPDPAGAGNLVPSGPA